MDTNYILGPNKGGQNQKIGANNNCKGHFSRSEMSKLANFDTSCPFIQNLLSTTLDDL